MIIRRTLQNLFLKSVRRNFGCKMADQTKIPEGESSTADGSGINGEEGTPAVDLTGGSSDSTDYESDSEKNSTPTTSPVRVVASPGSAWAPEQFSILSWNLDGLDEKNLDARTEYVVEHVLKENYSIIFFQELLPHTFHFIASRLQSKYLPLPGTDDPNCEYLVGTFLRLNHVIYTDHDLIKFPGTCMGRNVLVTKAFSGRAKLCLLNTHLESTAEFSEERKAQLKMCFDLCRSMSPDYNVIFGGDLNLRDKEVVGLLPDNMCDLWIRCGTRNSCQYTWDLTRNTNKQMPSRYQPRCRFDRLYFRESVPKTISPEFFGVTGMEKVPKTQSFPSDHWGIISFFRLEQDARRPNPRKRPRSPSEENN